MRFTETQSRDTETGIQIKVKIGSMEPMMKNRKKKKKKKGTLGEESEIEEMSRKGRKF